jgi:hypothetical protein
LVLCTASTQDYADNVLDSFGLTEYFSQYIYRENLSGLVYLDYTDFVLIDNLPITSNDIEVKLTCVGVPYRKLKRSNVKKLNRYHILVPEFNGDPLDTELLGIYDKVKYRFKN